MQAYSLLNKLAITLFFLLKTRIKMLYSILNEVQIYALPYDPASDISPLLKSGKLTETSINHIVTIEDTV